MADPIVYELHKPKIEFPIYRMQFIRPKSHQIDVTVRDVDGNPVARDVVVLDRLTKAVIAQGRSHSVTGELRLYTHSGEVSVIGLAEIESDLPDIVVRTVPEPVE